MERPLIDVRDLNTYFFTYEGIVKAVEGLDLTIWPDEIFGLVGETGCGKSVASLSIMKLIRFPPGKIMSGKILLDGEDLVPKTEREMLRIRGEKVAMIFQDPMSCLNPVKKIGEMMSEVIRLHLKVSKKEALNRAAKSLEETEMPDTFQVVKQYPHELSGGMRQRVMIATALSLRPRLLLADEPTTALDVTIQAQILRLLRRLNRAFKTSIMIITHNLGVVAQLCDRVAVMYAGGIVEVGSVEDIFERPAHPYTIGLIDAIPKLNEDRERLKGIEGGVPNLIHPPPGCRFHPRCGSCSEKCQTEKPIYQDLGKGHRVACHLD
jgi:oligopeptide/dipeptide ABC transporter ATP-binding protein